MKKIMVFIAFMFLYVTNVYALTGVVNVNDSLTLRDKPTTSGNYITSFYNNTELTILDTNAGSGNGCGDKWYKVRYSTSGKTYEGYSCGSYIKLNNDSNIFNATYNNENNMMK